MRDIPEESCILRDVPRVFEKIHGNIPPGGLCGAMRPGIVDLRIHSKKYCIRLPYRNERCLLTSGYRAALIVCGKSAEERVRQR